MGYYDEEFYDEPSDFEQIVVEMKKAIAKSIKEQFVTELERLRTENAELQTVKRDWESIRREYAAKNRQLEIERQNIERQIRRERLTNLMQDLQIIMYSVDYKREIGPKCDKCDSKRRINYKTPLGREAHEECDCATGNRVYYPSEHKMCEFRMGYDGNGIIAWYKPYSEDRDGYVSAETAKVIYEAGMDYAELERYGLFFRNREECQRYCDYLNSHSDTK